MGSTDDDGTDSGSMDANMMKIVLQLMKGIFTSSL